MRSDTVSFAPGIDGAFDGKSAGLVVRVLKAFSASERESRVGSRAIPALYHAHAAVKRRLSSTRGRAGERRNRDTEEASGLIQINATAFRRASATQAHRFESGGLELHAPLCALTDALGQCIALVLRCISIVLRQRCVA